MRQNRERDGFLRIRVNAKLLGGGDTARRQKSGDLRHKLAVMRTAAGDDQLFGGGREERNAARSWRR